MTFLTHAVSFLLVVVLCLQHSDAQSVPDRCRCQITSSKPSRWKNIDGFSITAPRSRCKATEIILTLKTVNAKTNEKERRCISPNIYQGEYLQQCWNRINKDGRRATIKMSECGISRNTAVKIENTTTVSQQ
ncbi:chemokine (C-X-C motif) ligand 18b [Ictalurus furcatus]|uniref:chemokine (C-X-C motif) ligand 18b n=1 Tax=Ictalurus furcatus TaxID=66913 RepID=UPI0023500755|nr:chemokine (C-X-C motif) ligand 18b [Ictalurus furcatus]